MSLKRLLSRVALPTLAVAILVIMSSCRPMITPEQLQELKELRAKEKSLNAQISSQKDDISKIKREISSRESELKKCNEESDFVKQKLSQWPNVWPDWQPKQAEEESENN